jgi:NADH-quinone oxidoreductase subunit H
LTALSMVPFARGLVIADVNIGLLVITAVSSLGILGVILGGWASNSHYSLLGSLRSAAQLVSYEVALSLALLSGVMAAGSLSMVGIVTAQKQQGVWFIFDNYGFMIVPFVAYFISSIAEVNRAPFDLPEAESELVAGFMTEYSGFRWALYFLAEYTNILVFASVAVTLFLGGWLRPFPSVGWLDLPLNFLFPVALFAFSGLGCFYLARRFQIVWRRLVLDVIGLGLLLVAVPFAIPFTNAALIGLFWFFLKVSTIIYVVIWVRATFPRLRYDQLMNLGWKVMIPLGMAALLINAVIGIARQ